jgi:hypothetical protein
MVTAKEPLHLSFEEWLRLVFDHPVSDEPDIQQAWYWRDDLIPYWELWWEDPSARERQVSFATNLFSDSASLLVEYRPDQIRQGVWLLLSGPAGFSLDDLLCDEDISLDQRRNCVFAMRNVFATGICAKFRELDICSMWWDLLRGAFDFEQCQLNEAFFSVMVEGLSLPYWEAQESALHGLGHIDHPGKRQVIETYLSSHADIEEDRVSYARNAIEGKVL